MPLGYDQTEDYILRLYFCDEHSKCDSINNNNYIKTKLAAKEGIIVSKGWKAKKVGKETYLVTYFHEEDTQLYAFALEVNLPIESVRNEFPNQTLKKRYWNVNEYYPFFLK